MEQTPPFWIGLAYLVAGICFILALRGLSSPATSQRGNRMGIIGMAIAVVTTLVTNVPPFTISFNDSHRIISA